MATDLKNRPSIYDPDEELNKRAAESGDGWRPDGFDEPDFDGEKNGSNVKKDESPAVAGSESNPSPADGNASATNKQERALSDQKESSAEIPYKPTQKKSRFMGKFGKNKLLAGGGFLTFGVSGVFAIIILTGPFKLIDFSQFLQRFQFGNINQFSDDRSSRLTQTYRRFVRGESVQSTRLGRLTGRYADVWDQRLIDKAGVRPVYDSTTGIMSGYEIVDEQKARSLIEEFERNNVNTDGSRENITGGRRGDAVRGRVIDLRDASARNRQSTIRSVIKSLDSGNFASAVGSRLLGRMGGVDFRPVKNILRRTGQSVVDYRREKSAQRAESVRNGAADPNARQLTPETEVDPDGNESVDANAQAALDGGNQEVADAVDARENGRLTSFRQNFATRFAGGAAAAIGALCIVRDIGNQAEELQYANTVLVMMRIGFEFMSVGSQIQSGQGLNMDEVGYYLSLLHDEESGLGHYAAASAQATMNKPITGPDIGSGVKPTEDGLPLLFRAIDAIPGLGTACGLQGALSNIPVVGGALEAASSIGQSFTNGALEATIGITPDDLVESVVNWLAGEAVNLAAEGAELTNYAIYGTRLAANLFGLSLGGRELNTQESGELRNHMLDIYAQETKEGSFYERYLSITNFDSLAASTLRSQPTSVSSVATSILHTPTQLFSTLIPKTKAVTPGYDFGFDPVGYSVSEMNNPLVQDPYANAEFVEAEANFSRLNEQYGSCFPVELALNDNGVTVTSSSYTDPDAVNQFNNDDALCNSSSEELLQFRMYIADTMTAKSLACYEGDTQSCTELGFETGGDDTAPTPTGAAIVGNTADIECPAGTGDAGEATGYSAGQAYNIRLCTIPGFVSGGQEDPGLVRVNSTAAASWLAVFTAAAEQGVTLNAASSFRSNELQAYLFGCYVSQSCNNGNEAAEPGTSNHQMGFAVDIDIVPGGDDPALSTCRASPSSYPRYQVLQEVAPALGISAAVESECWHWSTTGG